MSWQVTKQPCDKCGHVEVSVHPATCEYLECSICHHMNPSPYINPAITDIERAAASWVGTPFCENSRVKGAGVSCHFLPVQIYIEAGLLPADIDVPNGPPGWSRTSGESLMERWLDSAQGLEHFAPVEILAMQPGDMVGFKAGRCVHHVAVLLTGGRIVHCMEKVGVRIGPNIPPAWKVRMPRAWRPKGLQ